MLLAGADFFSSLARLQILRLAELFTRNSSNESSFGKATKICRHPARFA